MSWLSSFYASHPEYRRLKVARRSACYVAEAELPQDLAPKGARGFLPSFGAPFQRPIGGGLPSESAAWYLSGGVSAANCVAAYQPKGAASLAASYVNLNNPGTYDAAPGVAPTWNAATGWTFSSASSQYLTTGISPDGNASWSVIVRLSNVAMIDSWAFGLYTTSGFGIQPYNNNNMYFYNGGVGIVASSATSGVWGIAGKRGYFNGSASGSTITGGTFTTTDIYIGDVHYSGGHRYLSGNILAFAIYNITLDATKMSAVSTAMAAL